MTEPLSDRPRSDAEEQLAAEHPTEFLRRREFIARTAAIAGAAGLGAALPLGSMISAAAGRELKAAYPKPRNLPIDHFVVLMMENRSFDHYLGWRPDVDGRQAGLSYPDAQGKLHKTHPLAPDFQGCGFMDPDHSWDGGREEYAHGKLDGFYRANDEFAIGYYVEKDLPFLPALAQAFTTYDRYFAALLGPTYPNRHYQWAAQSGGQISNVIPSSNLGNPWETIFDRAQAAGLDVGYYYTDVPFAALYGSRGLSWARPIAQFYDDAAAGNLPNLAFVDPGFLNEDQGLSSDEHPHGDPRVGQFLMSEVVDAFLNSPNYRRGAMFVNYDEWGGFFDHVSPMLVPDDRSSKKLEKNFGITGFRTPAVAISPWARRGYVSHAALNHVSILKLIAYRFRLGWLNTRHRYSSDIGRTFDFAAKPNYNVPDLPTPDVVVPVSCSPGKMTPKVRRSARAEGPELPDIADYAEGLGFEVHPPTPERVFAHPGRARALGRAWRRAAHEEAAES
jgi:phospholipase C